MRSALLMYGALSAGCWAVALFFFRFWRTASDRLFGYFAAAFFLLGAHWLILGLLPIRPEARYFLYVPRLIAFLVIIVGVIDKNRRARRQ